MSKTGDAAGPEVVLDEDAIRALRAARAAEKEQTLFYRALAAAAEEAGAADLAERLNDLLADEQHHLSRLTARLLELRAPVDALGEVVAPVADLSGWEAVARRREEAEVARYEALLEQPLDETTSELVRETLRVEREHARNLAGKWTAA